MSSFPLDSIIADTSLQHRAVKWVFLALLLPLIYTACTVVYNVYLHPLADYPGPKRAAASRVWYVWHDLRGDMHLALLDLHKKYGDVVRIAPDELSYISPDAWNDIYGHRIGKEELIKDPGFYSTRVSGPESMFRATRARHGHIRKQISHGFSEKALLAQEPTIRSYADLCMERLTKLSTEGPVDLVKWYNFFSFDIMGELVLGESFNGLGGSEYHPWVALIFDTLKVGVFLRGSRFWPLLRPLTAKLIPKELARRRAEQVRYMYGKVAERKNSKTDRLDLSSGLLKPESDITDAEFRETVQSLIVAGSETTATLLDGVTYYLLTNPDKLEKAKAEVRGAFDSKNQIDHVELNQLPYMLACLNEALRVYTPVATGFPRNTGPNHELICGKMVPPYTVVQVNHFPAYHHPGNFTQPDAFIPERWIDEKLFPNDRTSVLQPFAVGPRNCVGKNLAYFEMRLMLGLMLWSFDMELMPESKSWIDQETYGIWEKKPLMVKLTARKNMK